MKVVLVAAAILLAVLIIGLKIIGPATEPLTELYFTYPNDLQKTAVVTTEEPFLTRIPTGQGDFALYYWGVLVKERAGAPKANNYSFPLKTRLGNSTVNATLYYSIAPTIPKDFSLEASAHSAPYPVDFTVSNRLGVDHSYTYTISIAYNGVDIPTQTGTVRVRNNETVPVSTTVEFSQPFARAKVSVSLDTGERIHVWVES